MKRAPHHNLLGNGGFSLVELLVASSIMVIAIVSIVTIVRKGGEMDVTDRHRRMARSIINSTFESTEYSPASYSTLANATRPVVIDPRDTLTTADNLNGTLQITVTPGSVNGANATVVPYKNVTMTVAWSEPEGSQSVTLTRWLAQ
jgi:Tfp pilus assembly protein PilV